MRTLAKITVSSALMAIATLAPLDASASTVVDGKCTSVSNAAGCLFSGNISNNSDPSNANGYVYAQNQYNYYVKTHPGAGPDITLKFLADSINTPSAFTGLTGSSGTWKMPNYTVDYVAVKAGNYFTLYKIAGASSGNWNTHDIPYNKNPLNVSHVVLFGTAANAAVPEPASWGLMIAGFGLSGAALRRRTRGKALAAA